MPCTRDVRRQLLALVRTLDPETMSGVDAALVVQDLAAIEKLAATGRMFAAVRVARTDAWRGQGHASASDWLAAQAGISVRAAAAQLATAKKAESLPKTKQAMKDGDLSADQANAVADAASADPTAEDDLIASAKTDTNRNLKDKAAKTKAAATDTATRDRRIRAHRSLRRGTDADGAFSLHLYGPGIDAARFEELLRPYEEHAFADGRARGARDTYENRSYDAFIAMLAHHNPETAVPPPTAASVPPAPTPPDPERAQSPGQGWSTTGRSAPPPSRLPRGHNTKVIVLIDHSALLRGHANPGETCEIAGLGPISAATARDLMHDAFIAVAIKRGKDIINVAHSGRGLNAHQRTALEASGLRCSNRSCNQTIALQIDHRVEYRTDPVTKLDNQDPLCPECHRRKTHHGWHLEPGTGPRRFLPPDAEPAPTSDRSPPPPARLGSFSWGYETSDA